MSKGERVASPMREPAAAIPSAARELYPETTIVSLRGFFAGIGAVGVLYVAVSLFRIVVSIREQKATGLAAVGGQALEQLLHPAFVAAALVVFLTTAYWANKR